MDYMQNKLIILVYHHTNEFFGRHIALLKTCAELVSLRDGIRIIRNAKRAARMVAITFDDAYEDIYIHALPVLKREGIHATLFVPTHFVGREEPFWWDYINLLVAKTDITRVLWNGRSYSLDSYSARDSFCAMIRANLRSKLAEERKEAILNLKEMLGIKNLSIPARYKIMNWDQISEMSSAGNEIGSHCVTHEPLTMLSCEAVIKELSFSKRKIEEIVGCPVRGLAYPFGGRGFFNDRICSLVRDAGYQYAVTTVPGVNSQSTDRFRLHRYFIGTQESDWVLWAMAIGLWPYLQPLRRVWHLLSTKTRVLANEG